MPRRLIKMQINTADKLSHMSSPLLTIVSRICRRSRNYFFKQSRFFFRFLAIFAFITFNYRYAFYPEMFFSLIVRKYQAVLIWVWRHFPWGIHCRMWDCEKTFSLPSDISNVWSVESEILQGLQFRLNMLQITFASTARRRPATFCRKIIFTQECLLFLKKSYLQMWKKPCGPYTQTL